MEKINTGVCIGYNKMKDCYFVVVKESAKMELRIVATFTNYSQACNYLNTLENKMNNGGNNETKR